MNIGAVFSTDIMMLDAMLGTGLSMASGSAGWGDGPYGQDYSMTTLYYLGNKPRDSITRECASRVPGCS